VAIRKKLIYLGIIWIVLNAYDIPNLLTSIPFGLQYESGVSKFVNALSQQINPCIKKEIGIENQSDLAKQIRREFQVTWLKNLIYSLLGLITGLWLLSLNKKSRIFAIVIAALFFIRYAFPLHRLSMFRLLLIVFKHPQGLIYDLEIISGLIEFFTLLTLSIFTIIYLTRTKVKEQFK
jgi:hypothetical protein